MNTQAAARRQRGPFHRRVCEKGLHRAHELLTQLLRILLDLLPWRGQRGWSSRRELWGRILQQETVRPRKRNVQDALLDSDWRAHMLFLRLDWRLAFQGNLMTAGTTFQQVTHSFAKCQGTPSSGAHPEAYSLQLQPGCCQSTGTLAAR